MALERRASGDADRRRGATEHRPRAEVTDKKASGHNQASASKIDDAVENREKSADLREDANLWRESAVREREDSVHGREKLALHREGSATERELENQDAQLIKAAQEDLNVKLRQANERLIIGSIHAQILTEEIERSKEVMSHMANHDFLTNLPNRMQLHDRIEQAIASAKRRNAQLAVLFLDLDRFKIVNDSMGHAIGDQLLQSVAQRLKSAIRDTDTVSRHGGDEFVLMLTEVAQEKALGLTVNAIREIVTAPYTIEGNQLQIGATIGISIYPKDGDNVETLIRNADAAMYYAKENGRNMVEFYRPEIHAQDIARQDFEASLLPALDQQQFVLFYQAQIDPETGAVTGAESLIRWHHPTRGLLLPAWFIPVAEKCGAIVAIGRWVLREACRQAQRWLDENLVFNIIAVNISAHEFESVDFLAYVQSVLKETGLPAQHLELELTETVLMKRIECTATTLQALRAMGVRISIDDFGTGYSSLNYLKRFPVDTMKIDQSFVRDIASGDDDILINAIIGIGKSLRYQVIAEGVETHRQLAFLCKSHCSAVQGFYLNKPMCADEFAEFLKHGVPATMLNGS